jgi:hypothetical protein
MQTTAFDNSDFHYSVEFPINTKISYDLSDNDILTDNILKLYSEITEGYELLAKVSEFGDGSTLLIESLILKKSFTERQDVIEIFKAFRQRLQRFLYLIRYISYEDSASLIDKEVTIIEFLNDQTQKYTYRDIFPIKSTGRTSRIKFLTQSECEVIFQSTSIALEKYIARYVDAMKLSDSVARLISLSGLCELINKEVNPSPITIAPEVNSTRHLVAHGVVDTNRTVQSLNSRLNTPNATSHKFNRNDPQHMELVKSASDEFSSYLTTYISSQFPQMTTNLLTIQ